MSPRSNFQRVFAFMEQRSSQRLWEDYAFTVLQKIPAEKWALNSATRIAGYVADLADAMLRERNIRWPEQKTKVTLKKAAQEQS